MTPRRRLEAMLERLHAQPMGSATLDQELSVLLGLSETIPMTTTDEGAGRALPPGAAVKVITRLPRQGPGPGFKAIVWHPGSNRPFEWWAESGPMARLVAQLQMALHLDWIPEGLYR